MVKSFAKDIYNTHIPLLASIYQLLGEEILDDRQHDGEIHEVGTGDCTKALKS